MLRMLSMRCCAVRAHSLHTALCTHTACAHTQRCLHTLKGLLRPCNPSGVCTSAFLAIHLWLLQCHNGQASIMHAC
jgi:hypothetical protein